MANTFTKGQQWRPFIIKPARGNRNRSHRLTCDGPAPLVSVRDVTCVIDPTPTGAHASTRNAGTRLDGGPVDGRNELKGSMERMSFEKTSFIIPLQMMKMYLNLVPTCLVPCISNNLQQILLFITDINKQTKSWMGYYWIVNVKITSKADRLHSNRFMSPFLERIKIKLLVFIHNELQF